jgi:hypothetical protein
MTNKKRSKIIQASSWLEEKHCNTHIHIRIYVICRKCPVTVDHWIFVLWGHPANEKFSIQNPRVKWHFYGVSPAVSIIISPRSHVMLTSFDNMSCILSMMHMHTRIRRRATIKLAMIKWPYSFPGASCRLEQWRGANDLLALMNRTACDEPTWRRPSAIKRQQSLRRSYESFSRI